MNTKTLLALALVVAATTKLQAQISFVDSSSALGASDSVNWSQLGLSRTDVSSGVNVTLGK